jgi:hypothetical protein
MKFKVYHAKEPTFGFGEPPKFPKGFEKVALVEVDEMSDVFRVTNHIDENWTFNPEVLEAPKGAKVRSTSVGDVVADESGEFYVCATVGWEKLDV